MADKTYINGAYIKSVQVGQSEFLKLNIPEDKLVEMFKQLKENLNNGWVRLVIKPMKEPRVSEKTGKVTSTHFMMIDDWKPGQEKQPYQNRTTQAAPAPKPAPKKIEEDDVPF